MIIELIRHGATELSERRCYQGRLDTPLSETGKHRLEASEDKHNIVYITNKCRTAETAAILFREAEQRVISELREMDFGDFEGRNYLDMENDADYRAWVARMGELLDCPEAAQAELDRTDRRIAEFEAELEQSGRKPLRALYVIWDSPLIAAGADSLPDAVGRLAGLENIISGQKGYPSVSLEFVLNEQPDVIVWFAHGKDWKSNPSWHGIRAVSTDHVLDPRDDSALLRAGPRIFDGIADLKADLNRMFTAEESAP